MVAIMNGRDGGRCSSKRRTSNAFSFTVISNPSSFSYLLICGNTSEQGNTATPARLKLEQERPARATRIIDFAHVLFKQLTKE
jgi:hypothetical protein